MRLFAYVQVNESLIYEVNNRALFCLIRDGGLDEEAIFDDGVMDMERVGLRELLQTVERGDIVMVRSLTDLAATTAELMESLRILYEKGVEVVSVVEQGYNHLETFPVLELGTQVVEQMAEKKRRLGMERAKNEGRMGRKQKAGVRADVLRLRAAGVSPADIIRLCKISRSTYYRTIKK